MGYFNHLLYAVIFLGFIHPNNSELGISVFGSLLPINVISLLIATVLNLICSSKNSSSIIAKETRLLLVFLVSYVFILEFIFKPVVLGSSIDDGIKSIRVGIFGFCVLALCITGFKCNVEKLWRIFLISIAGSFFLSLFELLPIIDIPTIEYSNPGSYRLENSNASFGVIGLFYLLLKDKMTLFKSRLFDFVSILSVLSLILTFNRTYLISLVVVLLCLLLLSDRKLKVRTVKILSLTLVCFIFIYFTNDLFRGLFESRFLSLVTGAVSITDPSSIGGRAIIYKGVTDRILQGYWVLGLPFSEPIFIWPAELLGGVSKEMSRTDTTFINILLRYGIFTLFLYLIYLYQVFWRKKAIYIKVIFLCYFIASVNVDSMFLQNSFFFLCLFLFFIKAKEKNYSYELIGKL